MNLFLKICILLIITLPSVSAQNEENKWVIGIGSNAIDFFPSNELEIYTGNKGSFWNEVFNVNDHWNHFGLPKINVTRHLWNRLSLDIAYSRNTISKYGDFTVDDLSYSSLDLSLQYSILNDNDVYYPYLLAGTGYSSIDGTGGMTLNSGVGITYWLSDQLGVNGEGMFKYREANFPLIQHFHYSLSLVYRFGDRGGNGKGTACF